MIFRLSTTFEFGKLTEYTILHALTGIAGCSHLYHDTAFFNKRHLMWEAHNVNMGRTCCPSELGCLEQVFHGVPLPDSIFR